MINFYIFSLFLIIRRHNTCVLGDSLRSLEFFVWNIHQNVVGIMPRFETRLESTFLERKAGSLLTTKTNYRTSLTTSDKNWKRFCCNEIKLYSNINNVWTITGLICRITVSNCRLEMFCFNIINSYLKC